MKCSALPWRVKKNYPRMETVFGGPINALH